MARDVIGNLEYFPTPLIVNNYCRGFYFDGRQIHLFKNCESVISICPTHRSRLEIQFREQTKIVAEIL